MDNIKTRTVIITTLSLLLICDPVAADLGRLLGNAGVVAKGMQEGEESARRARLQQLQLEEANRQAEIKRLEYELKIRQLRQGQIPAYTPSSTRQETGWEMATSVGQEKTGDIMLTRCIFQTLGGYRFAITQKGLCPTTVEINHASGMARTPPNF